MNLGALDQQSALVFPSPCGVMERKLLPQNGVKAMTGAEVSVPLRGNGAKVIPLQRTLSLLRVSVPLRGNGAKVWIFYLYIMGTCRFRFPSPCGVMERKLNPLDGQASIKGFPSPCGVMERKSASSTSRVKSTHCVSVPLRGNGAKVIVDYSGDKKDTFPSPCGVMERKSFAMGVSFCSKVFPSPCGVMERKLKQSAQLRSQGPKKVSVPLRGNGAKGLLKRHRHRLKYLEQFPSPCGVMERKRSR